MKINDTTYNNLGEKWQKTVKGGILRNSEDTNLLRLEPDFDYSTSAQSFNAVSCGTALIKILKDGVNSAKLKKYGAKFSEDNIGNVYIVNSILSGLKKFPIIIGEKIKLNKIRFSDAHTYYDLYTDNELNKYWGYDYHDDIKKSGINSFYEMQKNDYLKGEAVCLAIRIIGKPELIGETVVYNFESSNRVEIGCRIFKRYFGNGYGKEAFLLTKTWCEKVLQLKTKAKCYKQNAASEKMILFSGMKKVGEDNIFNYFEA